MALPVLQLHRRLISGLSLAVIHLSCETSKPQRQSHSHVSATQLSQISHECTEPDLKLSTPQSGDSLRSMSVGLFDARAGVPIGFVSIYWWQDGLRFRRTCIAAIEIYPDIAIRSKITTLDNLRTGENTKGILRYRIDVAGPTVHESSEFSSRGHGSFIFRVETSDNKVSVFTEVNQISALQESWPQTVLTMTASTEMR